MAACAIPGTLACHISQSSKGLQSRVWCADFKGWFRTADGQRIEPLTISDAHSRYLLRCQAVEKTDTERVRAIFEAAFREYGLPQAIRTDNGAPFASAVLAGLSRLAVWWIKLGIVPERIEAGHPEQNGRHERMHRTLKQEVAMPAANNRREQQHALKTFLLAGLIGAPSARGPNGPRGSPPGL
jgi:transposase InsO family protein